MGFCLDLIAEFYFLQVLHGVIEHRRVTNVGKVGQILGPQLPAPRLLRILLLSSLLGLILQVTLQKVPTLILSCLRLEEVLVQYLDSISWRVSLWHHINLVLLRLVILLAIIEPIDFATLIR